MPGQAVGGHGLGLGQVVAFGFVGQPGLDHVEGGQVGPVILGPGHPHPDQGPRGQVHAGGVVGVTGQDEHGQRRAAGHLDARPWLDGPGDVPGRAAPWGPGRSPLMGTPCSRLIPC